MSNVLEFRPASAGGPVPCRQTHATADIILFPGVRYEREAAVEKLNQKTSPGGGKRSRRKAKTS